MPRWSPAEREQLAARVEHLYARSRRLGRIGLALGVLTLLLALVQRATGGPVAWTTWALVLVVVANGGVNASGLGRSRPRVAMWVSVASAAVSVAATVGILVRAAHPGPSP